MKKLLIAACLALTTTSAQALSDSSDYSTGQDIYIGCVDPLYGRIICHTFLVGMVSGMILHSHHTGKKPYLCVGHLSFKEIKEIYGAYLTKYPERRKELAALLFNDAMEPYRCEQ